MIAAAAIASPLAIGTDMNDRVAAADAKVREDGGAVIGRALSRVTATGPTEHVSLPPCDPGITSAGHGETDWYLWS